MADTPRVGRTACASRPRDERPREADLHRLHARAGNLLYREAFLDSHGIDGLETYTQW